jgi:hypothetical protein
MKATLTFDLPQEAPEHMAAVKGLDTILLLDDLISEIRSFLKHECGQFKSWRNEEGTECNACPETLEKVRSYIWEMRRDREIPELP